MSAKVVYFGNDMLSSCFDEFITHGFQIEAVFVNPQENNAAQIIQKASRHGVPIETGRPTQARLESFKDRGVDLFFCAEYQFKIPLPPDLKYGVNLHTSLLPEGRGPTPLPYFVKSYPSYSGLTLHKLNDEFDRGDIILQRAIPVTKSDTLNSLTVKMAIHAPELLAEFLEDINTLYRQATPQTGGSQWSVPGLEERTLNFTLPVEELRERFMRFGHFGLVMELNQKLWRVIHAEVVPYSHVNKPGELFFEQSELFAIAIPDGFVCIPKYCLVELA